MKDERLEIAAAALKEDPERSDRQIAGSAGLAPGTVARLRRRLEEEGAITATDSRVGRDGKRHPAATAVTEVRRPGELPMPGLGELLGDGVAALVSPPSRRNQRHIAHYLKRLADALADQDDLQGWDDAEAAAAACIAVLGQPRAGELAEDLGYYAGRVYQVAVLLKTGAPDGQP